MTKPQYAPRSEKTRGPRNSVTDNATEDQRKFYMKGYTAGYKASGKRISALENQIRALRFGNLKAA